MINQNIIDKVKESYKEYDLNLRANRLMVGLALGIIFLFIFGILDFVVYEDYFSKLIFVRTLTALFLGILFLLIFQGYISFVKILGVLWAISLFISMDSLILITDGVDSSYYAGLNLILVALTVLLPWTFIETLWVCILMIALYVSTIITHSIINKILIDFQILINNLFFLIGTSIICITSAYFNSKLRFKEFCLNYELEEKNEELSKIDQMKTQFFANISHEFRTPLTLILGPLQDLLHDPSNKLPASVNNSLNIIKQNSFRLLKLVNDLLDVISLEEGKLKMKMEKVSVNEFVGAMTESMTHMANMKGIEIFNNVGDEEVFIYADENATEKIILNLLNNAIKFTPSGGKVEVRTRYDERKVIIEISDTGIGIKESDLQNVFERFKQVDSSDTRKYQGTGLGLALVKELTELQNGKIDVASELGKGTTFSLEFSLYDESLDAQSSGKEELSEEEEKIKASFDSDKISNLHKMAQKSAGVVFEEEDEIVQDVSVPMAIQKQETILIVDDEPVMLKFIVGVLKKNGYNVLSASDGQEGIDIAKEKRPEIILFDLMLPSVDGLKACKILKEDESLKLTKVILLTARTDEEAKITALSHGADDFITKPFSSVEVMSRINNLLQNQKLQKNLHNSNDDLKEALMKLHETKNQLIHSEKINAIGNLSAGLLHEINNPLSYSLTAMQMMKADPAISQDADLKETLADIEEGMNRIKSIVSDLRAFAYPEEADKETNFVLKESVASAVKFTAYECKDIKVSNEVEEGLAAVGSTTHIVQVLINLITNAAKAIHKMSDAKNPCIIISALVENDRVKVLVKDNGPGMDEETLNKIFNPFFTTNEVGQGVGLGLSISHTIIKSHGGSLEATSELEKGTTFTFDLPLAKNS